MVLTSHPLTTRNLVMKQPNCRSPVPGKITSAAKQDPPCLGGGMPPSTGAFDTSTVIAIVYGIVSVAVALATLYIACRQLQLAYFISNLRLRSA